MVSPTPILRSQIAPTPQPAPWLLQQRKNAGPVALKTTADPADQLPQAPICSTGGADLQLTIGVTLTQYLLVELADAGLGHLVNDGPALRQLPFGDLAVQEFPQLVRAGRRARAQHHRSQRAFAPLLIRHPDHGGLHDVRVAHDLVFQVHRADPLTTGLDDVLGSVGEYQESVVGELADVARA